MSFCFSFISLKEISSWTPGASCWASQTSSWEYQWHGPSQSVGNARYQFFFLSVLLTTVWGYFSMSVCICYYHALRKSLDLLKLKRGSKVRPSLCMFYYWWSAGEVYFTFYFFNVIFIYPGSNHTLWLKNSFSRESWPRKHSIARLQKL